MTATDHETTTVETQQFAARMVDAIDSASVAILLSIGHQTSLFDTMADLPPATSTQIADAAGLDERYVREWLGGVVVAEIVDYDPATQAYSLPRERAAMLTRASGPDNFARVAQFLPMLGEVEQKVIGCFRVGGGLSYDDYPPFHELMAEVSNEVFDAALVDVVLPLVDGLTERLREGIDVADIGCGSGHAINVMAHAFPASRFTGIDFSADAVATGIAEAKRDGIANASFVSRDVAALDTTEAYDVITAFDAIHDQADPARVLENIHRALRPGGTLLMVDVKGSSKLEDNVGVPFAPYKYAVSTMHCMSVSLGLDGAGLGTVWGRQLATTMLQDAGFGDITVREIDMDAINFYYIAPEMTATLPQLSGEGLFVTDGGLETELVFHDGRELPCFAAFPLLDDQDGRERLRRYFDGYLDIARRHRAGFVVETPTWRANPDWATQLGYSPEQLDAVNRAAVELAEEVRAAAASDGITAVVSGCIGPRGDGYDPGSAMTARDAEEYHAVQIGTFASTTVDQVTAITMTNAEEAIGIIRAATAAGLPVAISFTVETDGRLPTGQSLREAIEQIDAATDNAAVYFMVNCAHPTHFASALDDEGPWLRRIAGLRTNASTKSHAEVDEATELDEGDTADLGRRHTALRASLPALRVVGGCCGTDARHVSAMFEVLTAR